MSAGERNPRLEKAFATLAEMARRLNASQTGSGRKIASIDDARAWLAEKVGKHAYTQAEIDRRLDEFIEFHRRRDAGESRNEAD
jgi:hypothetical protein